MYTRLDLPYLCFALLDERFLVSKLVRRELGLENLCLSLSLRRWLDVWG